MAPIDNRFEAEPPSFDWRSLKKVYRYGADEGGKSDDLRFKVPPRVTHGIQVLIASGKVPYRTYADFARDAVARLLFAWEEELKGDTPKAVMTTVALLRAENRDRDFAETERLLDVLERQLRNPDSDLVEAIASDLLTGWTSCTSLQRERAERMMKVLGMKVPARLKRRDTREG